MAVLMVIIVGVVQTADAATTGLPRPLEDPARWATITHAGNAPIQYTDAFGSWSYGRVDHEYRISKTETTSGEWLEFVRAYAPYVSFEDRTSIRFMGQYTTPRLSPNGGPLIYTLTPGDEHLANRMGFRYVARYCNWLHNGKVNEAWAFESGAYDTSTFAGNLEDGFTDQPTHSPGARYWVPSQDEWVKAAYFDPNRYGPNQPGYWQYNITSDTAPISGVPGVGQTNARPIGSPDQLFEFPVGSYVGVESPWGLLDTSGGQSEWTETVVQLVDGRHQLRYACGSRFNGEISRDSIFELDRNGQFSTVGIAGLRLASLVPSPGTGAWCVVALAFIHRGRRSVSHGSIKSSSDVRRGFGRAVRGAC